jgi:hypothetical protein
MLSATHIHETNITKSDAAGGFDFEESMYQDIIDKIIGLQNDLSKLRSDHTKSTREIDIKLNMKADIQQITDIEGKSYETNS